jgi:AcrR family transcriptional regulator
MLVLRTVVGYAAAVESEPRAQDHAEMPTLPWQKPRRRRPAREPLTRERIVAAAITILDRDGLDAVSTRRVAEDLGTGSASLYAHVASRDELLELMVDRIAGEVEVPEPDPAHWQDQLRTYAQHAQQVWARHADITRASLASIPTGPNRLRVVEGLLAILRAAGFADQVAAWAVDRLQLYIDADVYEGSVYAAKIAQGLDVDEYLGEIRDYFRRLPADRFPAIASMADTILVGSDQRFEFGLDLFLDGLAARLRNLRVQEMVEGGGRVQGVGEGGPPGAGRLGQLGRLLVIVGRGQDDQLRQAAGGLEGVVLIGAAAVGQQDDDPAPGPGRGQLIAGRLQRVGQPGHAVAAQPEQPLGDRRRRHIAGQGPDDLDRRGEGQHGVLVRGAQRAGGGDGRGRRQAGAAHRPGPVDYDREGGARPGPVHGGQVVVPDRPRAGG